MRIFYYQERKQFLSKWPLAFVGVWCLSEVFVPFCCYAYVINVKHVSIVNQYVVIVYYKVDRAYFFNILCYELSPQCLWEAWKFTQLLYRYIVSQQSLWSLDFTVSLVVFNCARPPIDRKLIWSAKDNTTTTTTTTTTTRKLKRISKTKALFWFFVYCFRDAFYFYLLWFFLPYYCCAQFVILYW